MNFRDDFTIYIATIVYTGKSKETPNILYLSCSKCIVANVHIPVSQGNAYGRDL